MLVIIEYEITLILLGLLQNGLEGERNKKVTIPAIELGLELNPVKPAMHEENISQDILGERGGECYLRV